MAGLPGTWGTLRTLMARGGEIANDFLTLRNYCKVSVEGSSKRERERERQRDRESERERERYVHVCIYVYIFTHRYIAHILTYIHIIYTCTYVCRLVNK